MTPARLAGLFALFGTLAVLLFTSLVPPYLNPDELAHFLRADQISNGGLLATAGPGAAARIDTGIWAGVQPFWTVGRGQQVHVERHMYAPVAWGTRQIQGAPNTAVYPPVLYLPAAAAIRLGKRAGLTVLPTLELCRAAEGLASVAVGAVAVAMAGAAALWLFAVLTLPMSLSQMAALGQDGLLIACTALAVSLARRLRCAGPRIVWPWFAGLCLLLVLVGTARPPYVAFALLALLAAQVPRRVRAAAALSVVAAVGAWCWLSVAASGVDPGHFNHSDARAQAAGLVAHSGRIVGLVAETYRVRGADYGEQFLGRLGWLDLQLPYWLRLCAGVLLAWAALCGARGGSGARRGGMVLVAALAAGGAVMAMFAIQYLTWTQPGADWIDGVQGRYLLPPALLLGLVFARPTISRSRIAAIGGWPVAVFPVVTIVVCVRCILLRYYF